MTFITHGFRISVVSDVRERIRDLVSPLRFMIRRFSLVECVSVLHGTCLQCVEYFFSSISMCSHVCQEILRVHILYHKDLADARIFTCVLVSNTISMSDDVCVLKQ
jgi:hypothetical protein